MKNKPNILVTGANGQLGKEIQNLTESYPTHQFTFTKRDQLDLSQPQKIAEFFKNQRFDIIINCAAYTAVDKAESEPELADAINYQAVKQLALIASEQQCKLIHLSTDYVFDGTKHSPYIETDSANPQSVYGASKLEGEIAIQQNMPKNALIIRTSWIYSSFGHNFVKTMLRLGQEREQLNIIFDQIGSPTYAKDLAKAILDISKHKAFNSTPFQTTTYHYSNEGVASWYDFSKAIFELANIDCHVQAIETKDYPTPAKRPYYSLLNKYKIKDAFELDIPYWKDSLKDCIKTLQDKK